MSGGATRIGVNIPWLGVAYGHDLGRNQAYPDWPAAFDPTQAAGLFDVVAAHGLRHIRFWLFEDGEGLLYDADGFVIGLDPTFLANLTTLVMLAAERRLRIYWVLLDANSVRRRPDIVTRLALCDQAHTRALLEHAIAPLLPVIAGVASAIEICNEPEAVVRGDLGNGTGLGFKWFNLLPQLNLLADGVRAVLPGVRVTIGSGFRDHACIAAGLYDEARVDTLDFHLHSHGAAPPPAADITERRPVLIGELGWPCPGGWEGDRDGWERVQLRLANRLDQLAQHGFVAIFLWFLSDMASTDPNSLVYCGEAGAALQRAAELSCNRP
jgi:hypothetical protein